ncbi:MAG: transcription elongation factor GreA [Ruminococcaceae bacterium]|nr:transcription elongation factor GreA [Oscillospiraceae bacterium]
MAEKQMYTKEGYDKLVEEYEYLTKVKREEVKKAISEAKSFGDLSENSEYDEARNEQAKVEARIFELDNLIQNAEITNEEDFDEDVVGLGSYVKLEKNGVVIEYSIVGSNEANPFENKISDMSVIGKSIIGKRAGDAVTAVANSGEIKIKILEVSRAK